MEKIKLANPAVVYVPKDTSFEDRDMIADLVEYKKCINLVDGKIQVADIREEKVNATVGIDAARLYCWIHHIPFRVVEEIDIDDIVKHCEEMDDLVDIMILLNKVHFCNWELCTMIDLEAPEVVKRIARLKLQIAVENLASNCHSSDPVKDDDGNMLSSLSCIGYHLKTKEIEE